jgi:hypothetical protein
MNQTMAYCETTDELIELWSKVSGMMQQELPWVCTSISHRVRHPDSEIQNQIQQDADHAVGVLVIVYMFSLLEAHKFKLDNKWLAADEKITLSAWRHLRNSGSHGFRSRRVPKYAEEFDYQMDHAPIRGVKSWNNENVLVHATVGIEFVQWLSGLLQKLVARSATDV